MGSVLGRFSLYTDTRTVNAINASITVIITVIIIIIIMNDSIVYLAVEEKKPRHFDNNLFSNFIEINAQWVRAPSGGLSFSSRSVAPYAGLLLGDFSALHTHTHIHSDTDSGGLPFILLPRSGAWKMDASKSGANLSPSKRGSKSRGAQKDIELHYARIHTHAKKNPKHNDTAIKSCWKRIHHRGWNDFADNFPLPGWEVLK